MKLCILLLGCTLAGHAAAQDAVDLGVVETVDLAVSPKGGSDRALRFLDNLDVLADADLDKLIGWSNATAHVHILNNMGARPNDSVATLQGVDNIEVATHRLRLFEAWVEQGLGANTTVRAGLYNVNSEFYANDAAALLLAPAFGIGSEFAATGPNGPSIFPSTALGIRIDHQVEGLGYVRAAILNGGAGTFGDPGGVDLSFREGALAIGEVGLVRRGAKLAFGYWRYTRRQDDYSEVDDAGVSLRRIAQGGYVLAEAHLAGDAESRSADAFLRIGFSEGTTTPFRGGWQAGLRIERVLAGRPDSAFSIGAHQGLTTRGFRDCLERDGLNPASAESAVELTYHDRLTKHVTVQPDVQWIFNRGGEAGVPGTLVTTMRFKLAF